MNVVPQPVLLTERLSLRPFARSDAKAVQRLAGDKRIADVTANIPHPYLDGLAEEWIDKHQPDWEAGERANFALTHKDGGYLMGALAIVNIKNGAGVVGYWLGVDYWGNGYMTEACRELFRFAAEDMGLTRLSAEVLTRNPASSHVLEKAGMRYTSDYEGACGRHVDESIRQFEIRLAPAYG